MKYAIVGAGAIGSLIAGFLSQAGQEVWLVGRGAAHMDAVNQNGLLIHSPRGTVRLNVKATNQPKTLGAADVVILLVKGPDTLGAVENIRAVTGPETVILTLQNGLGALDILKEHFPANHLAYGCVMMGGVMEGPGVVRETESEFESRVFLGSEDPALAGRLKAIADYLTLGGIRGAYTADIDKIVWRKLAGNCADNLCCGIVRRPLNVWHSLPSGMELARLIREEVCAVAQAKGIDLHMSDLPVAKPVEINPETATQGHMASTMQDVLALRVTENAFLNGAVVREGARVGVATPYNHAVSLLMELVENSYEYAL